LDVLASSGFKLVHLPIHTWAMSREDLLQVMRQVQQAKALDQKVLIHCYHGSDRTGASIAMYRIIFENWKIEDALSEMKYGGYGFHPVWMHIEKIFSPENVRWIQQQLSNPS
ncbi:MAG: dual specificity protein phosphatase family protein, partial [Acinetobacter sp.]